MVSTGDSKQPLRVHFFTLTEGTIASEHVYAAELRDRLIDQEVKFVDDWQSADVVHLFEVNFLTKAALRSFRFPTLLQILRSDTPVVISTDDLYFTGDPDLTEYPKLYPINQTFQRWLFGEADAIIAISDSVKESLSQWISEDKIQTIHHGVSQKYYCSDTCDDGYVFHVSIASKRKNPSAIVDVCSQLSQRFVIAGSGWETEIPERIQRRENVEILGYVSEDRLVDLYQRAAVFYFPTLHEGFGLPILEAMAAQTAVVTSDVYSVPEVVGDTACLFDPNDSEDHLEKIRYLMENDTEREQLAKAAHERARQFTWETTAANVKDLYHELTRAKTPSRGA